VNALGNALAALHAAGFADSELAVGGAIAFAESGFNPAAIKHEPDGSTSYGEWQINSSHGYPELASGAWSSLAVNAQLAKRVWDAQGWNAWSTHKPTDVTGYARYNLMLGQAIIQVTTMYGPAAGAAAAAGAGTSAVSGAGAGATELAGNTLKGFTQLVQEPLSVVDWLTKPGTWYRIGKVTIGAAVIIAGIVVLTRKPLAVAGVSTAKIAAAAA